MTHNRSTPEKVAIRQHLRDLARRRRVRDRIDREYAQPYGVRDCAFRDPSANLLRIQELR